MRLGIGFACLLLFGVLGAACLDQTLMCVATIPPPRLGAQFIYTGEGPIRGLDGVFPVTTSQDPDALSLTLSGNSTFTMAFADKTAMHFGMDGAEHASTIINYTVDSPGREPGLLIRQEAVDKHNGTVLSVLHPQRGTIEGKPKEVVRMGYANFPPALGFASFWGKELTHGQELEVQFPKPILTSPQVQMNASGGFVHWKMASSKGEGGCVVEAVADSRLVFPNRGEKSFSIQIRFQDGVPAPISFAIRPLESEATFTIRLASWNDGTGAPFPPFSVTAPAGLPRGLPTVPLDGQFLAARQNPFATSFSEVRSTVENDSATKQWFRDYPAAVPAFLLHAVGHPNSLVVDQWFVQWVDPSSKAMKKTTVEKQYIVIRGGPTRMAANMQDTDGLTVPPALSMAVTLDDMARVVQMAHGEPLEVLQCNLMEGVCGAGSHRRTAVPYAGQTGGVFSIPGLTFWLERGLLLQDERVK